MTHKSHFPLRVENLLSEAGASAYAWYEEELERHLDPNGGARKKSDAIEIAIFLSGMALATYCMAATSGHAVLIPILAMIYVLANWAFGRGFFPAPWKQTLALSVLSVSTATTDAQQQGMWIGIGTLAAGFLLTRNVMHLYREPALVAFHIGAALTGAATTVTLGAGWLPGVAAIAGGTFTGWVLAYLLQKRRAMSLLPVKLRREQFSWTLPDPPTRLPLLLRRRTRKFEHDSSVERKLGARSQEDAAIDIKKIGGAGERKTGLLLLGMKRGRWTRIIHDVVIPGATRGGNADHVVLGRSGGWVLDSKQFGSAKDPGVVRRTNTGEIVHATRQGSRDLAQTLRTVAWAVRGIRTEMQVPFRGLLVVHNAEVEEGLSVVVPGQLPDGGEATVDVISAQYLVAYLDTAPKIMSPWEVSAAHWGFQAKLVSATTSRSPQIVAPLGGGPVVMPSKVPAAQSHEHRSVGTLVRNAVAGVLRRGRASAELAAAEVMVPDSAEKSAKVDEPTDMKPRRSPVAPEVDLEDQVYPADPTYPGEGPQDMVDRRIRERWEQVEVSEPAAPDDVPEELRELRRGTAVSHLGFTADFSDVFSQDLVALSGPCQGVDGPFVWACLPAQWSIHQRTGRAVMASTVSLDGIAIRPQGGTGGESWTS